ncbi:helix-turn-helix domain-containing protein [Nonomuraea basaltis]|uniref:helix-turn-helix domain-containing protein n=1 Tax=Nonomuraea basaltis TaxID=2495887 RepID=UPI00110C652C|nr:helix-turn-helix domain-containing protein [Nonomuraea basaltis]TMR89550.1 helix-turn-helix domain-containing protein [Nonomuraea basaltis]
MTARLTLAEIQHLPAVVDVVTAGRALGMGRTTAYQLARQGRFPCRILRIGKKYLVPTAALLAFLGHTDHTGTTDERKVETRDG